MRLLADTSTLIWWWTDVAGLSPLARELLSDVDSEILVSTVSAWEIATKNRLGKLPQLENPLENLPRMIRSSGYTVLPISLDHSLLAGAMTGDHRDPFDRMLAAQAIVEGIPIASNDEKLDAFGCRRLW